MLVSLDFETRSRVELKKSGAWRYSLDPSTTILCTAWAVDQGEVECYKHIEELEELKTLAHEGDVIFCAYNAGFEYAIWHNILVARHGFPTIPIHRWRCSAANAMAHSLPRDMGSVAKALDLPHLKDEAGKSVMMRMCKPVPEVYQHLHGEWYESDEDYAVLMPYCRDDVEVERAIVSKIGFLPSTEQELWEIDLRINTRGVRVDTELAECLESMSGVVCEKIRKACVSAYGFSPSQVQKLKDFVTDHGVEIPKVKKYKKDKATGGRTLQEVESLGAEQIKKLLVEDIDDDVKQALKWRREFATTSIAKATAVMKYEVDGIVHYQFLYHGANTGRWSGKGIQLHNLPRGDFDEDWVDDEMALAVAGIKRGDLSYFPQTEMTVLKSALRGLVIPRDGSLLCVMDFSQIEARVLAWLAGQQEVLDAFIDGKDLYKFTAAQIYGKRYDHVTKDERFIGKMASLALGYQGAEGAFISMSANFGVKITKTEATKVKDDWRKRNPKIVKFWYDLQKAATRTVRLGRNTKVGLIRFRMDGEFLRCILPSGRSIYYYQPSIRTVDGRQRLYYKGSDQQRGIEWGDVSTYGGKLAENVTQAVSRDLLATGIMNIHKQGFNVVGHVHDEVIVEVDKATAQGKSKDIQRLLLDIPGWAKGLPVEADGFVGDRYRK